MKQIHEQKARKRHLASVFDHLNPQNQAYLETLIAQLAEIQETSPEKQPTSGNKPENVVQQNKEQDNQSCPTRP
jgi:hypothetical protein